MDKIDKILCPSCLAENNPNDVFCCKCNASIGQQATIDPVSSAVSEGRAMSDGIREPKKLIIVIGTWLFFGLPLIGYLVVLVNILMNSPSFENGTILLLILLGFASLWCLFFCVLTTRNYIRYKRNLINNIQVESK
jgi:hypothetical protein